MRSRTLAVLVLASFLAACPRGGRSGSDPDASSPGATAVFPSDASADEEVGTTDAGEDAAEVSDAGVRGAFGPAVTTDHAICGPVAAGGEFMPNFVARADLMTSFVDGDDILALVNRSPLGSVSPSYGPKDLVVWGSMKEATARQCEVTYGSCLRRDAAHALKTLLAAFGKAGHSGHIESMFRSYWGQCGTFGHWAHKPSSGFCSAVEQSALPGHSQHQLGTTVDLFTEKWMEEGKEKGLTVFRDGFGCTDSGRWLAEHSHEFGYVVSYPIHPDDRASYDRCQVRWDIPVPANPRTGYRPEAWHLRYIGVDNARSFWEDRRKSGIDTPTELSLEQWIRKRIGLVGDADLPVCDGCNCGACATLDAKGGPCGESALVLGRDGRPSHPKGSPILRSAKWDATKHEGVWDLRIEVDSPAHTVTQTPIVASGAFVSSMTSTFQSLAPFPKTKPRAFPDLPGAYRIGVEPADRSGEYPWRFSLGKPRFKGQNRANLYVPAQAGPMVQVATIALPPGTQAVRVALLRDGRPVGTPINVPLPPAARSGK